MEKKGTDWEPLQSQNTSQLPCQGGMPRGEGREFSGCRRTRMSRKEALIQARINLLPPSSLLLITQWGVLPALLIARIPCSRNSWLLETLPLLQAFLLPANHFPGTYILQIFVLTLPCPHPSLSPTGGQPQFLLPFSISMAGGHSMGQGNPELHGQKEIPSSSSSQFPGYVLITPEQVPLAVLY